MFMDSGMTMEMKIMIFPEKLDKFTGFFDKFLKNNVHINDCNQKGYHINMSIFHSDSAAKKVFRLPRICPQLPAFGCGAIPPSSVGIVNPRRQASHLAQHLEEGDGVLFRVAPLVGHLQDL